MHRLAISKSRAGTDSSIPLHNTQELIIGGDVTIDRDGVALAKAESPAEARQMLASLSGKTHMVRDAFAICITSSSQVTFRQLIQEDIEDYVASGEWEGKAGAYAIQGKAAEFVTDIQGSYFDILGLPIYAVASALISTHAPEFQNLVDKLASIASKDFELISEAVRG